MTRHETEHSEPNTSKGCARNITPVQPMPVVLLRPMVAWHPNVPLPAAQPIELRRSSRQGPTKAQPAIELYQTRVQMILSQQWPNVMPACNRI
jgi:hypothetical protein